MIIVQWWYTCKNVSCLSFFRRMKNTCNKWKKLWLNMINLRYNNVCCVSFIDAIWKRVKVSANFNVIHLYDVISTLPVFVRHSRMGTERQPRTPEVPGSMSMTDPLNNPHHGTTTNSVSKKKLHVLIVTGLSSGTRFTTYAANGFQCKGGTQLDDITFINPLKHFWRRQDSNQLPLDHQYCILDLYHTFPSFNNTEREDFWNEKKKKCWKGGKRW